MFKKIIIVMYVSVGVISVACSQQSYRWQKEIQAVLMTQQDAWNRGDIEGYMQGYWKSDSLLFTSGGNIQRGWNATYEKYKKSYDTNTKMGKLDFSNLETNLLSPESAWIFGYWELKREKDNPHGVFTLILRKFTDGWKIIHDHTSVEEIQKSKGKSQK
jgi:ketosteroid isomerase-like protein